MMSAHAGSDGGSLSTTVTVQLQAFVWPTASRAVKSCRCDPTGKMSVYPGILALSCVLKKFQCREHLVLPASAYRPLVHFKQGVLGSKSWSAWLSWHRGQRDVGDPSGVCVPTKHGRHSAMPMSEVYFPATQLEQCTVPCASVTVPKVQSRHSSLPWRSAYMPGLQSGHPVASRRSAYLPGTQSAHSTTGDSEKRPASHPEQNCARWSVTRLGMLIAVPVLYPFAFWNTM